MAAARAALAVVCNDPMRREAQRPLSTPGVAASLGFTPTWSRFIADVSKAEHLFATALSSMSRPLQKIITFALLLASPLTAQDAADSPWARLLERDKRVSFTSRTELAATTALKGGGLDLDDRAASLFALGASGSTRVRAVLEAAVASESSRDRCAAVLGLGEVGVGVRDLLEGLRDDSDSLVSECALLALMRTGRWSAAEYVEAVAESGDGARAEMAGRLLLFATDAPASEATEAARLLLDLRWRAAQRYGLIDSRAWSVHLLENLSSRRGFIKPLILKAAADLDRVGVKDCYLAIVGAGQGDATLRASLRAMPEEISKMIASGLWTPASLKQWRTLLSEVSSSDLEGMTPGLLAVASEVPALRYRAISLMVRAGDYSLVSALTGEAQAGGLGADQLAWCCEALGETGQDEALPALRSLSRNESNLVSQAALIAMARAGDQGAAASLREVFDGDSLAESASLIRLMNRWVDDDRLASLLEGALPRMEGPLAFDTAISLVESGSAGARGRLREFLKEGVPAGAQGARAVRALTADMTETDIEFIRQQFPLAGDLAVNEALALALFELRDPIVVPLIRASIWHGDFNESVLASALLMEVSGASVLFDEIDRAPVGSSREDVRRIGYALGLWGGVPALRELSSKRRSGDPALQGALLGALASRTQ